MEKTLEKLIRELVEKDPASLGHQFGRGIVGVVAGIFATNMAMKAYEAIFKLPTNKPSS